ncbi:MAG: Asp-tRNA(Asn)/Glu-tRNA(Gln) amidotransferase subunit GatA [Fusicatenibacter sp.]|nr:Asp-tRNA(Asn)/Glu-tRNA(Gln) amidotransferase subunit GatA [Lachnospiraceae bacterium]MDY2939236.1 Asp-tRNA(Asn)/Glu-tRNA(Gln) amidotransferase subunit GatA [Fusicatenibacter sp.]
MEIMNMTAVQLSAAIREGRVTVRDAVAATIDAIKSREESIHAFLLVDEEKAFKKAEEVQKRIDAGELTGPLCGVPIAIKDNICTKGMKTTCASKILYNFVPTYTAEAVQRLEDAGAIVIGKTNMDEFAMGSTTETSAYGVTRNPWNTDHVPGGSSGGSCAAVAAGEVLCALGSDTGGSIRQPSSFCGVTGMKPTYGTVSRYGLIAYGSSLDQIGPVAKDVTDCAAILQTIASYDKKDATSMKREDYDFMSALKADVSDLKIGIPNSYFGDGLDPQVKASILSAAEVLKSLGAEVEFFDLDLVEYAIPAYYVIASAEASSNLERFDGVKYGYRASEYEGLHDMYKKSRSEGFGPEVKRRIMLGSFVLSSGYYDAYYLKALRTKALIKEEFNKAFEKYDMILSPAAPSTAPRLGESLSDPIQMYLGDIYTVSVNLAGLPGITVPCGIDDKGLPIGMQLIGDCFAEKKLLRAAYTYEQARGAFPMPKKEEA